MTLYDSSLLIDYLDGVDDAVDYIESNGDERALAPPLVLFELYQGEVYRSGEADFDAIDAALSWLVVVESTHEHAQAAAELQNLLHATGAPLSARDAYIAGIAASLGETLAVSDSDFDVAGIHEHLDVEFV